MLKIKKVKLLVTTVAVCSALVMTSCSTPPSNQDVGPVAGGVIGGLIGSQFGGGTGQIVATAAGAVVGAYLGNKIGQSMDETDQLKQQQAMAASQPTTWTSQNGNTYTVKPHKTYVQNNEVCRQYTTTAVIEGKTENITGTACKQPNGTWKVVS